MMKRIFSILLALVAVAVCAAAQGAPVKWRTFIRTTDAEHGTVVFRAIIEPGWHLYAMELPDNGPKPTTFDLSGSTGIEFTGKVTPSRAAIEAVDPLFDARLGWWDSKVEFTVPFRVTDAAKATLKCTINYMSCDGTTCRPPSRENISTPVKLKPAAK